MKFTFFLNQLSDVPLSLNKLCERREHRKYDCYSSASEYPSDAATMASGGGKQATKIVSKNTGGGTGAAGGGGAPPAMPLASPLMGKKKKPFLGMPAPLGYVPGLGRG